MIENTDATECLDCKFIGIAKVYRMLVLITLAFTAALIIGLFVLSYVQPAYLPNFSMACVMGLYLLIGILMGISMTMQRVVGKDWLKLIKAVQQLPREGEADE